MLLPGDKKNTTTGSISYGAYDKGGILLSREYYKRKSQGIIIEGGSKESIATKTYVIKEYCY